MNNPRRTSLSTLWKRWKRERQNKKNCQSLGKDTLLEASLERRGEKGELHVGEECWIQGRLILERDESRIRIGDRVAIGGGTILDCALGITIEDDVIISYDCILADSDNHSLLSHERKADVANWKNGFHDWSRSKMDSIRICQGAWVGARACILKGVTIGNGAVVGMGSVVTRDVPSYTVVAGNPAREVRRLDPGSHS
jgi:acetyltransferase-like isoleucine patch superfamily enzyme